MGFSPWMVGRIQANYRKLAAKIAVCNDNKTSTFQIDPLPRIPDKVSRLTRKISGKASKTIGLMRFYDFGIKTSIDRHSHLFVLLT